MRVLIGVGLMFGIACAVVAADDIDPKKLIGKWEPSDEKAKFKAVIEYTAKRKVTITFGAFGENSINGTYKIEGNKLTQTIKVRGEERTTTNTIVKLTDTELVTENEKGRKTEMKRVKDEKKDD